jgi:hypothetical protein
MSTKRPRSTASKKKPASQAVKPTAAPTPLGAGFAFVERQKHIVIDGEDFYLDLLFFHRRLRRLVLVELKLGAFKPADFGQTTLFLRLKDDTRVPVPPPTCQNHE